MVICNFWPLAGFGEREVMKEDEDGNSISVLEGEDIEPVVDKAVAVTEIYFANFLINLLT
jgi:hypothetical protein